MTSLKIEVDITNKYITKDVLRLIATYLIRKASAEEIKELEEHFRQNNWGIQYYSMNMLTTYLQWEKPNRLIKVFVPILLSKSYESEGCDFPSAEIFADIAYVILGLPRPMQRLKQVLVAKEIVDFIHKHTVEN